MSTRKAINIVWLKRDIRSQDHLPLHLAEQSPLPYLIIFILEPSVISYPDTSFRHLQFQYHAILQLNHKLNSFNKKVEIFYAEARAVFDEIHHQFDVQNIFSYQESGIRLTYERDKEISKFCKEHNIRWKESQRDGIQRGISNRNGWDKQWYSIMHSPLVKNEFSIRGIPAFENNFSIPDELTHQLKVYSNTFQPAGEVAAWRYLKSFIHERGKNYNKHISKPAESRISCARISPYLSWGNISVKQAYQYVYNHSRSSASQYPFTSFLTRLKWHCHFIQKFEVECSYETACINHGYELLEHSLNEAFIHAWKMGDTGYPLVDACMKCLIETGWLNFRMRSMLVSFFCHHLYQDWRWGVYHLANLFLDYEPGIHYPQFQMQAGTTGVNTIRIYNPVKQSQEHDPQGVFIKKWLPQLKNVPTEFIHEPYKMSAMEQEIAGIIIGKDYPMPIVDLNVSAKIARKNIWSHRNNEIVKQENKRILTTHTRRKEKHRQP